MFGGEAASSRYIVDFYSSFNCCQPRSEGLNLVPKCQLSSLAVSLALRQFVRNGNDTGYWHKIVTRFVIFRGCAELQLFEDIFTIIRSVIVGQEGPFMII